MKKLILAFLLFSAFCIGKFSEREMLILPSANEGGGIFFNVVTVLGFLRYCEKNKIDSFAVNYQEGGLYYESPLGPNWWHYFFEPIHQESLGQKIARFLRLNHPSTVSQRQIAFFNYDGEYYLSRQKAHALISKYIRVKPEIAQEVEAFRTEHFAHSFVIGVHYRGTDKYTEAPEVEFERVKGAIEAVIADHQHSSIKIFVATDTQKFIDYISPAFPGQIITTKATRSTNGKPLHYGIENKEELYHYRQGKETIIDALLLSHTDILIRTSSNLSLCSSFFNPDLPVIELNKKHAMERQVK